VDDVSRDDTAHQILRTIRQVVRRISEHSRQLSRDIGLTVPQLMCLKVIGELEEGGDKLVTVNKVSHRVQLSPATVSRIIDRLERGLLVTRERASSDRRKVSLSLTAAGYERYQTLPTPLQETFLQKLEALPMAESERLLEALRQISELMEATDLDASPLLAPGDDVKHEPQHE
jgi:DNA-binding MarR family transcriptional regulator